MKEMLCNSVFFGVMVSILAYEIGMFLKKKWKLAIFNPLLVSIVVVIVFLAVFHIDYESYETGAHLLSYFLTPACNTGRTHFGCADESGFRTGDGCVVPSGS